jgi:hypothetical protein
MPPDTGRDRIQQMNSTSIQVVHDQLAVHVFDEKLALSS